MPGITYIHSDAIGSPDYAPPPLLQHAIGDEALIDATQCIHESLQNALGFHHDFGTLLQGTPTPELFRIVHDYFDAKHALAFGINLQRHLAAVQLEDRQIIRRFLDRDLPFGGLCSVCGFSGSEDNQHDSRL